MSGYISELFIPGPNLQLSNEPLFLHSEYLFFNENVMALTLNMPAVPFTNMD